MCRYGQECGSRREPRRGPGSPLALVCQLTAPTPHECQVSCYASFELSSRLGSGGSHDRCCRCGVFISCYNDLQHHRRSAWCHCYDRSISRDLVFGGSNVNLIVNVRCCPMSENWGILHPLIAFGIMILFLLPGNALLFVIGCQVALVYIGYHVSKKKS